MEYTNSEKMNKLHRLEIHGIAKKMPAPDQSEMERLDKEPRLDVQGVARSATSGDQSDRERVMSLYRWICHNITYDVQCYREGISSSQEDNLGIKALTTRMALCTGYAVLFQDMCRSIDIECQRVRGYGKGHQYVPGCTGLDSPNHEWNMVRLEGRWYPVDCTWGAGYIREGSWEFISQYREHFLFTDPRDFIRDHFPVDERWQLLEQPVSLKEFKGWAVVKPAYFTFGCASEDIDHGIVHINGTKSISFSTKTPLSVTYKLIHLDTKSDCSACVKYLVADCHVTFSIFCPMLGRFVFSIYGKSTFGPGLPTCLMTYILMADQVYEDNAISNLSSLGITWGTNKHFDDLGLSINVPHSSCLTIPPDGISLSFKHNISPVAVKTCLYKLAGDTPQLITGYVLVNCKDGHSHVLIKSLPVGTYSLVLYGARYAPKHCVKYNYIGSYMIIGQCDQFSKELFPRIGNKWSDNLCDLKEPRMRYLPGSDISHLQITLPEARRVYCVCDDGQVTYLVKTSRDTWQGDIIPNIGTRVATICAKYDFQRCAKLLEYDIEHPDGVNHPNIRQA